MSDGVYILAYGDEGKTMIKMWQQEAQRIMMDRGVYVTVSYDEDKARRMTRIYFKALEREFDSVHDLYKVLNNKAFL